MRRLMLKGLGIALSVLPPAIATLSYFPVWQNRGTGAVLSGFTAIVLLVCAIPIFKALRRLLASPSAWLSWLVIFIVFSALSSIAEEMVVISFIGFIFGAAGAICFKIGEKSDDGA